MGSGAVVGALSKEDNDALLLEAKQALSALGFTFYPR